MIEAESGNHGRSLPTRYTLLDKLGAGGQGEVWRARDETAGVEVALKVLSPSHAHSEAAWASLAREYAIASTLEHPLILKVQAPYREGDFAALPMELALGGDLRKLRGGSYLNIVPVLIDLAQALEYAHEHGVIHRDLKPGNVLFDARGRVRITDFGIASAPGVPNGSVAPYGLSPFTASPEQLRGDPPAFSDDIYGLGALAYELLSGYPPYYPRFEVKRVLEEPVPEIKPAQLMPPQLGALIMRMLSKRAALRPRSMREVIDELDATLNDTLTFDFEPIAGADDSTRAMKRDASVLAAAEAAKATREGLLDPALARSADRSAPKPADPLPPAEPVPAPTASGSANRRAARIASAADQSAELAAGMAPKQPWSTRSPETRATDSRAVEARVADARRAETHDPEARAAELRRAEVREAEAHVTQHRSPEDRAADIRAVEARMGQAPLGDPDGDDDWEAADLRAAKLGAADPYSLGRRPTSPTSPRASATAPPIQVIPPEPVHVTEARASSVPPIEAERIAVAAAAVRDVAPELGSVHEDTPRWDDLRLQAERAAHRHRYPEARRRSWPWVVMSALAAAAVGVFVILPRYGGDVSTLIASISGADPAAATASTSAEPPGALAPEAATDSAEPAAAASPSSATTVPAAGLEQPDAAPTGVRPAPDDTATARASGPAQTRASGGTVARSSGSPAGATDTKPESDASPLDSEQRLKQNRAVFDQRLAALDARGAGVWGGADFAAAKTRAAESVGAHDAGSLSLAEKRLAEAQKLLVSVESRAVQNLATQLATGDRALAAGQGEVARQAFESARRIDPSNRRATEGLQRVRNLGGVLPLLADGENAEAAKDYARAVQDYSQALSLDPSNAKARAGLDRAHAAFGQDEYAKAVGTGFAALGAGRLDEARVAFEKARRVRPSGAEAQTGLQRVGAALSARGYASTRQRAAALEAEERWTDAFNEYDAALKVDPSLVFAQQGRARAASRADLSNALQSLLDRPERLAAQSVRAEAEALLRRAAGSDPSGPVLRSQIARLQILLPEFDIPVRLELVSDNATQVQIQRVGTFGTFSRREIELKPGKYTVVGTRPGFRDVRRDVTIGPGHDVQTISVSCVEPI